MPSREPELYKDKIEVSLDGRQIFYLFFGGAVIVGIVFVLGVLVGRRVEARGHLDHARTQTATDPLAALDRLEGNGSLSFQGALTGKDAPSEVEKTIGEIEKARAAAAPAVDKKAAKVDKVVDKAPEKAADKAPEKTVEKADAHDDAKSGPVVKPGDVDKVEKSDKDKATKKPSKKHDDSLGESDDKKTDDKKGEGKTEAKAEKAESKAESKDESKARFTLQLSSFQDKAEADAFLSSIKAAGYQAYVTQAEVDGKGTFYRVRLGTYRSLESANGAKAAFEKDAKKSASVMKL
jgi:DedD protein